MKKIIKNLPTVDNCWSSFIFNITALLPTATPVTICWFCVPCGLLATCCACISNIYVHAVTDILTNNYSILCLINIMKPRNSQLVQSEPSICSNQHYTQYGVHECLSIFAWEVICYDSGGGTKRIAYQNLEPSAFDIKQNH